LAVGQRFRGVEVQLEDGRCGSVVFFTVGERSWSEEGLRLYATRRAVAGAACEHALQVGLARLVVEDGVAFAVRAEDRRPGWDLADEHAVQLMTARVSLLAHELL
jgi:hypothetical protein